MQANVDCGVSYLDAREELWWQNVDKWLDMSDCEACVIGQIYGNYYYFLDELEAKGITFMNSNKWAEAHGFSLERKPNESSNRARWEALSDLWRVKIEERFSE
jgi:hypothetical protein